MKISNLLQLLVIGLSLSACGGGGSAGNQDNANEPLSFKTTTSTLFSSDENSEPMDLTLISINADADDDETAFVEIIDEITKE